MIVSNYRQTKNLRSNIFLRLHKVPCVKNHHINVTVSGLPPTCIFSYSRPRINARMMNGALAQGALCIHFHNGDDYEHLLPYLEAITVWCVIWSAFSRGYRLWFYDNVSWLTRFIAIILDFQESTYLLSLGQVVIRCLYAWFGPRPCSSMQRRSFLQWPMQTVKLSTATHSILLTKQLKSKISSLCYESFTGVHFQALLLRIRAENGSSISTTFVLYRVVSICKLYTVFKNNNSFSQFCSEEIRGASDEDP